MLELQCADAYSASALYPVAEHFRRALATRPGGIEALLADTGVPVAEATPVVAALLGGSSGREPAALKRDTVDVVLSYVLAHAERRPVLVVVEDLHWADPSTLELLAALLDAIAEAHVLLVATTRLQVPLPALQPRQPARARPVHAHRGRDAGGARGPVAGGRGA